MYVSHERPSDTEGLSPVSDVVDAIGFSRDRWRLAGCMYWVIIYTNEQDCWVGLEMTLKCKELIRWEVVHRRSQYSIHPRRDAIAVMGERIHSRAGRSMRKSKRWTMGIHKVETGEIEVKGGQPPGFPKTEREVCYCSSRLDLRIIVRAVAWT